jgi:hypothetical protein
MRSKFEAWIPKLGCDKAGDDGSEWRFDVIEVRSLDSEAWMRGGCDEAGVEVPQCEHHLHIQQPNNCQEFLKFLKSLT